MVTTSNRRLGIALGMIVVAAGWPVTAGAQGHRARLSADLEQQLTEGSQAVAVIVNGTPSEIGTLAQRYNLRVKRPLKSGAVFELTAGQLDALSRDEQLDHVSSDLPVRSAAAMTAVTIGADQVWAGGEGRIPLTGAGVGVAIVDSGIDLSHQALASRVIATVDFTGGDGTDGYGHGTHVAGLVAGAGGLTPDTAAYRGIAPGARLVNLRVLGADGTGVASSVIEAIDWAIEHRAVYNIRVMNLSLGAPVLQSYEDDPLCAAVGRAVAAGIVVVAAAGNFGRTADGKTILGGVTSPANHPDVIAVGALDTRGTAVRSDDGVAAFSSRGPTLFDRLLKPDLVAPGTGVVSAEASGSTLATRYAERHVAGGATDGYLALSGTSMSAAVVSGAAALLVEARPRWSSRDVRLTLQLTSSAVAGEGLVAAGAGSVNVVATAEAALGGARGPLELQIAGEATAPQGLFLTTPRGKGGISRAAFGETRRGRITPLVIISIARQIRANNDTIIWGADDTIIWGSLGDDTIIWGSLSGDTIIWGNASHDTIIWGSWSNDTIIWGANDTTIWGAFHARLR